MQPNLTKSWTTHMGILVKALLASSGDVVELGAGPFSTPLLHWVCKDMDRRLTSFENDPEFYRYAKQFRSRLHSSVYIEDWDKLEIKNHCGLIFVDHHPAERRGSDIIKLKDAADLIVIHDTNNLGNYTDMWPNFKYTYTWKGCSPWVSVVSNSQNLSSF